MIGTDDSETLTSFRDGRGYGEILFDRTCVEQVEPEWFFAAHWGTQSRPVSHGGRGGAWFVDAPSGAMVLRHYLRGGWAANFSRDGHLWRGSDRVRSFCEFHLTRRLYQQGLAVPRPIAAYYRREGAFYRAAILVERLNGVHTFAERATVATKDAPWEETGRLIARFHDAGLDHADLNANNILFDASGCGWLIDLDRSEVKTVANDWRERNLARLKRSLLKLRGARTPVEIEHDFARLRGAYDAAWTRSHP